MSHLTVEGGATEQGRVAREVQQPDHSQLEFYYRRGGRGWSSEFNKGLIASLHPPLSEWISPSPSHAKSKQFSGRWRNRPELPGVSMEQARTKSCGVRRPADQPPVKPRIGKEGQIKHENNVKRRRETSSISGCLTFTKCLFIQIITHNPSQI